jgi:hypothetical protein
MDVDPALSSWIERRCREGTIRRALLLLLLGFFAASLLGLGCMTRRPAGPPLLSGVLHLEQGLEPTPGTPPRALIDAGAPAPVGTAGTSPQSVDAGGEVFDTLEFREDTGSVLAIPYKNVSAIAINAQHSCIVIESGGLYQAILDGDRLEPLYAQLLKRKVGRLEASSLASGGTFSIPVVAMSTLLRGRGPLGMPAPLHPMIVSTDAPDDEQPVVTRVRVCIDQPFHFRCDGSYVADNDIK